jgi:hypothetical protein
VSAIAAKQVVDGALIPSFDARCHNLRQRSALFNPDAELNSLVELLPRLERVLDDEAREVLRGLIVALWQSNEAEGQLEREVLGWADETAHDLHHEETTGQALGVKAAAGRLRDPLAVLEDVPALVVDAVRQLDAVLQLAASSRLLTASMRNQLGPSKFATLQRLTAVA